MIEPYIHKVETIAVLISHLVRRLKVDYLRIPRFPYPSALP